jgi:CBS domain-containing protein
MSIADIIAGREGAIVTCAVSATVEQAAQLLAERRIGALPVLDGGRLAGIFSERDLLYSIAREGAACLPRSIHEVMTASPVTVDRGTSVNDALALMTRRRIRHLPVMDGQYLIGFVSIGDLVKHRIEQVEYEARQMRAYIQSA